MADKKLNVIRDKAFERTKLYYRFISKGDNFIFKMLPKTNQTLETKYMAVIL